MERRETVYIQIDEILPNLFDNIRKKYDLSDDVVVEYTSKTRFLTFLIKRDDDN